MMRLLCWVGLHRFRSVEARYGRGLQPHCTRCGLVKKPDGWVGSWRVYRLNPKDSAWFTKPKYPQRVQ